MSTEQKMRERVKQAKINDELIIQSYYDLTFTPDQLEKEWEEGSYRWWNIGNWRFVKREEVIKKLRGQQKGINDGIERKIQKLSDTGR